MTEVLKRAAVVVGGGSGIGAAVVRDLSSYGYRVAALSPSGRAAELAREHGGVGLTGSNRSVQDLQSIVDLALTEFGRIDAVINGTGHGASGPVLDLSDADWEDGMDGFLMNVVRMARIVTPYFEKAGGGSIVNISTSSPLEPNPRYPVSAVFRASLASFTKLYTDEFGPAGIRMNNVLPGYTKEDPSTVPPEWTQRIPLRRAASTQEIAQVVRFLAGQESSYVTGQNIRVDGGVTRAV
ncbi:MULTISPECIES: SDR family oxidoreductase [Arthrobacter]|uniref:SDR family oxidoreductase n=1 Tax=Arthrobacter jinronghuae TaxID=2964609 RepID=A0ABT1NMD3_9MICC|nr:MULTISPECIES: SDR family oxidoreductase [Arthrobacter]MCQ1948878.1 SDR family oxidoreductase [Arthrobacter jinronghuae]MCQ1952204.1 SDR family oxidoreductase [Arthrobacter sp. zg-Y238]UWX78316.1 SDR family oxidoreductase [Arthrobacter jinronghuae]